MHGRYGRRANGVVAWLVLLAGCIGWDGGFDSLVDEVWLDINAGELRNASEYLQAGGSHYDMDDSTRVDIEHVVPLCDRIERECAAECFAILFDDDSEGTFTIDILVRLSRGSHRGRIVAAIAEAEKRFPGKIDQTWGTRWMTFSFVD